MSLEISYHHIPNNHFSHQLEHLLMVDRPTLLPPTAEVHDPKFMVEMNSIKAKSDEYRRLLQEANETITAALPQFKGKHIMDAASNGIMLFAEFKEDLMLTKLLL